MPYVEPYESEERIMPVTVLGSAGYQASPGNHSHGGGVSGTQVEVDFGTTPVWRGKFTITDAAIGSSSKVFVVKAGGPYTGKGTRADEAEMDLIEIIGVTPAAGSATVYWRSVESHNPKRTPIPSQLRTGPPTHAAASGDWFSPGPDLAGVSVRGKIKGNIKFNYLIAA
jgi:hypothetical protein